MEKQKVKRLSLLILLCVSAVFLFAACNGGGDNGGGVTPTMLDTPSGLSVSGTTLNWTGDINAVSYTVQINSNMPVTNITATSYPLTSLTTPDTYFIRVKAIGDGTNYTDSNWSAQEIYTVNKTAVTVKDPVFNGTLTYGDALPVITTATAGGTIELDTWQTLTVGTNYYSWTFTPADTDNYTWSNTTGTISLTVAKKTISVEQPTFSRILTYGDKLPAIITTTTGGTIELDAGQILTAGTKNYNWTFTPVDKDNYEWTNTTGTISLTVAKKTISVAQPSFNGTLTYGGELPEITTITTGGVIELNAGQILTVGTKNYNWTFTPADTDNYTWSNTTGTISLTVEKGSITVAQPVFSGTLTYGDALPSITTTTTGGTIALNIGQTLTAGTKNYNWTFTPADTDNYSWSNTAGTISLTVAKKIISVVQPVFSGTLAYGDELPAITTTTTGGTIALTAGQTLTVGTSNYNWTFTPADTDNYSWSNTAGTISLTVAKAAQTIPQSVTFKATLITVTSIELTDLGTAYEYSLDESNWQNSNIFSNLTINSTYTFYTRLKGNANYFASSSINIQRQITVISEDIFLYSGQVITGLTNLGKTLTSITIPSQIGTQSITSIAVDAFKNNTVVTNVIIAGSVINIGSAAFSGCSNLTSITIPFVGATLNGTSNTHFGYIFGAPNDNYPSYVPSSLKTVIITGGKSVATSAFRDCRNLTSITIPNSVTGIGNAAFISCSGLVSITIPDSVISIGSAAFRDCTGLTEMTIPFVGSTLNGTSNTYLGYIFGGTNYQNNSSFVPASLKTVIITGGNSIGLGAFDGCAGITSITIPDSITSIGQSAFSNCTGITSITIPSSVTDIEFSAFYGCKNITSIIIPDSVKSIGEHAFNSCSGLRNVTILSGVTEIGGFAFQNCTGITSITIPDSVTDIGYSAFSGCNSLTSVIILNGVIRIGFSAFNNCSNLVSIIIPGSVTSIGFDAFTGCSILTIYVETASKPSDWHNNWNYSYRPVVWGCTLSNDKTYVVSFTKSAISISDPAAANGIAAPYREGYTFGGWSTAEGGLAADYTAANINSAPNGTTLYAIWEENNIAIG